MTLSRCRFSERMYEVATTGRMSRSTASGRRRPRRTPHLRRSPAARLSRSPNKPSSSVCTSNWMGSWHGCVEGVCLWKRRKASDRAMSTGKSKWERFFRGHGGRNARSWCQGCLWIKQARSAMFLVAARPRSLASYSTNWHSPVDCRGLANWWSWEMEPSGFGV